MGCFEFRFGFFGSLRLRSDFASEVCNHLSAK